MTLRPRCILITHKKTVEQNFDPRRFKLEGDRTESLCFMNFIYLPNDSLFRKTRVRNYFYQVHCWCSSINFSTKTLIRNKVVLPASNLLKVPELVKNEQVKNLSKII